MVMQRFFRLTLPIAMTSIIVAILVNFSLMVNLNIDNQFANNWIKLFYHFQEISIDKWFSFSFYEAITLHGKDNYWLANSINPVLWTMPIEFMGSMLVFLTIFLFKCDKRRWFVYVTLALYFIYFESYMFHFILGVVAAEIYIKNMQTYDKLNNSNTFNFVSLGILFCLLILCGIFPPRSILMSGLMSFLIITLCAINVRITHLLEKSIFLFLGKICFTLYLIHLPIITSFSSFMLIRFERLSANIIILIVGILTVVLCLVSAWLLSFAERALMRLYKKILV
jgi:peptidoglycan/LPS O-acetylase OafA/YrhL